LAPRGLVFNEDKTAITCLDEAGVDFLGYTARRYHGKLLITPSMAAVKRFRARLSAEMRALRGPNAEAVLQQLNPIIRGWAAYYRIVVSSKVFNDLDDHLWKLIYKWAKFRHPHQSKRRIVNRYFGMFNKSRRDRWGVRRPRQRRLPTQVLLDEDRAAHHGQGLGVPRRPDRDRLLGLAAWP
jgi:RNA-directed DNA polymerase